MLTLQDYDRFCLADPVFYDLPERYPDEHDRLAAARRPAPPGWERTVSGWCVTLRPHGTPLPGQGWQIHVSVVLDALEHAVDVVWEDCVAHGLPFSFARSRATARELAGDRADRFSSGRLLTVHPAGEDGLAAALGRLAARLGPLPGPYVPGALRHGAGPLHVRYGTTGGQPLRRPDGTLVPEPRRAVFAPPEWVPLPPVLRPDLETLRARPVGDFPYRVRSALRQGNGSGTYLAVDRRSGDRVVLRGAGPHAGPDRRGEDAPTRLRREHAALERLAGLDCVPRPLGLHQRADHLFAARTYIEGTPLLRAASAAFPLTSARRAAHEAGPYTAWALGVADRVGRALDGLLGRGLRLTELHPRSVLLCPGGRIALVGAGHLTDASDDRPGAADDPGFGAPGGLRGAAAHRHLLDRLRLWLFLPLPLPRRGPAALRTLASAVEEHYPVPRGFATGLLTGMTAGGHAPDPAEERVTALLTAERPDWPALRDSLVAGLHACATPGRDDRLFPGTPTGPAALGGHSLGHGAAGVLYALHRAGAAVPAAYPAWLVAAARRDPWPRPGLYDGLHGVALTLETLGLRDAALDVLDRARSVEGLVTGAGLAGGSAGIALVLLYLATATGDAALRDRALRLAARSVAAVEQGPWPARPGGPAPHGLLHGPAGVAVLCLRLYEETGEEHHLDAAARALRPDLARLHTLPDGTVTLAGDGNLPYLQGGSTGLAFALRDYLRHRPDRGLAAVLDGLRRTCDAVYVHNAGLFRGRSGCLAVLAALGGTAGDPAVRRQVRRLAWHARCYRGHLAFPGFRGLRLSADLATGAAGVLLALAAAFGAPGPVLPFLGPPAAAGPYAAQGEGGERRVGEPGRPGDPGTPGPGGGDAHPVAV
ncbi:serine/threonine protein kinase [Streptomyces mashuensis]|uniref:Serine/threonine protein kinase n=1 Tax=Streptomyces mashuensis TaxID=33904 RepID=A0A919EEP1_9ACTN|nr:class III lanthionine synthetase LanKC [Streptomyces mashuensis]GHF59200.1 serine/threonine protein kinase [Streptomyces mashuensis]